MGFWPRLIEKMATHLRKRQCPLDVPEECFISHSYRDPNALALLLGSLPNHVRPYIFPPIAVRPDELVSTHLIDAILRQEGLIYLRAPYSSASFWVAFEKEYGKRAERRVFSFGGDKSEAAPRPDTSPPAPLNVYPIFARSDFDKVDEIVTCLADERFFDVFGPLRVSGSSSMSFEDQLSEGLASVLRGGGYAVLFWSDSAASSSLVREEILEVRERATGRLLVALLDATPLPDWLHSPLDLPPVQLFGDENLSARNRWDNLIVFLYWLAAHDNAQGRAWDWDDL